MAILDSMKPHSLFVISEQVTLFLHRTKKAMMVPTRVISNDEQAPQDPISPLHSDLRARLFSRLSNKVTASGLGTQLA